MTLGGSTEHFTTDDGFKVMACAVQNTVRIARLAFVALNFTNLAFV